MERRRLRAMFHWESVRGTIIANPSTSPLDAHPLIREYFAQQLRQHQPEAFRAAHSRLFDHFCEHTEPHQPDTLESLGPLYQAVVHGCLAGRQPEAREKVYRDRILRGAGSGGCYSTFKLGAIGANLAAVAAFFEQPWSRLSPNLSEADQAWLLNEAAFSLRALGRLTEALEPMRVSGGNYERAGNDAFAARLASNLSELEVTLGRLGDAVADARRAIGFADRSGDWEVRMGTRTTAADALHQSGERDEARTLFEEAETLQREGQPEFDLLYSVRGFRYCDLLLAPAEHAAWVAEPVRVPGGHTAAHGILTNSATEALAEAERRGNKMFEWRLPGDSLLDIALDQLTLARVALFRALLDPVPLPPHSEKFPNPHLSAALDGLRQAGQAFLLCSGLLTAAHYHHLTGDPAAARDLDEAHQIAERGPMPLYLADIRLHRARLFGSEKSEGGMKKDSYPWESPRADLRAARELIEKHGYWRRKEELEDAEEAAKK